MYCRSAFEHSPLSLPVSQHQNPSLAQPYQNKDFLAPLDSHASALSLPQLLSFAILPQIPPEGVRPHYPLANTQPRPTILLSPTGDSTRLMVSSLNLQLLSFNYQLSPLTPFPATLTSNSPNPAKTAPVTPLDATLTDTPSRKSFRYVSYEKHRGVGGVSTLQTYESAQPGVAVPRAGLKSGTYENMVGSLARRRRTTRHSSARRRRTTLAEKSRECRPAPSLRPCHRFRTPRCYTGNFMLASFPD